MLATHRPPFPLDNGARIRVARLAQGLLDGFDLTLVTFADGPAHDETRASRAELEALLPGARIELVTHGRPQPRGARRRLLRAGSAAWGPYATQSMRATLRELIAARPGAVLHLDMPGVAPAGLGLAPGRTVFSTHNVEHRIWRDLAAQSPLTHRPFLEVEWRKILVEERRCCRGADLVLGVSELDVDGLRRMGARQVAVVPNGADAREPLPPAPMPSRSERLRLLFVGSGAYWPYERGLAWFVNEVMPLLRQRHPTAFDVVGERPRRPVWAEGVTYHGRVDDLTPFYAEAHAVVVPVFEGSGTRLKVIEAAMFGRPVISTRIGVEGLPVRPGEHYVAAETAAEFVAAADRLRHGEPTARDLVAGAREALGSLTWTRIASRLAELYEQI